MTQKQKIVAWVVFLFFLEALLIAFVDKPVSEYLRVVDKEHNGLINFFRAYTDIGLSKWYLWPAGIGVILCAIFVRIKSVGPALRKKLAVVGDKLFFLFVIVALAGIAVDIIKPVLGRARPVILLREGFYGFHPLTFDAAWKSMPSGHANTCFALACVLAVLFPRLRILWFAIAFADALSRVMVNAHYVSDVIAGAVIGCAAAYYLAQAYERGGIARLRSGIFPIDRLGLDR